jgi:hypothetical protein
MRAVVGQIISRLNTPVIPLFEAMSGFAAVALAANVACLLLLWKHRQEDLNMASVWESRNDIASNIAVLVAAAAVAPDRRRLLRSIYCAMSALREGCTLDSCTRAISSPNG